MHRVENKTAPSIFLTKFCKPSHPYPTNFSAHNFLVPTLKLKKSKYRVSIRGPLLWNNILTAAEKTQESLPKFRTTIKGKLLSMTNEINYFWIEPVSLWIKLLKFNYFALKIKGLDEKTLMVFCKFLPVIWYLSENVFCSLFQLHSILFYDSIHILCRIRMLYYGNNVTFQDVG